MLTRAACPLLLCVCMFLHNAHCNEKQLQDLLWVVETYEHADVDTIISSVKTGLLSQDALLQDAACIILLKTTEGLKKGTARSNDVFTRLSGDQQVVRSAAEIVDSRLLGWYNPANSEENEDDIAIYAPLFVILGKANDKMARGTLARAILYLRNHPDILDLAPFTEELASLSLRQLGLLQSKLCCAYPGKDPVAVMLEKDSRYALLERFAGHVKVNARLSDKMRIEMKKFVLDCLCYGDSKNGYVIRSKAAELAGLLVKKGERELLEKIRELARTDPHYVHVYFGKAGFSLRELNYPVREQCLKILRTSGMEAGPK